MFEEAPHQNSDNPGRQYNIQRSGRSVTTVITANCHPLAGSWEAIKSFKAVNVMNIALAWEFTIPNID